jgi:hypothetical protein
MPSSKPPLTVEQILAWADAHHARAGTWPTARSGPVANAPVETWKAIDHALVRGHRGLPEGDSLARLLNRHREHYDRRRVAWTAAEDDLVRTLPPREVAERTGRTLRAVYHRRPLLGLSGGRPGDRSGPVPRPWTAAEDEAVRTLPALEAAQRTGRSLTAVYSRRRVLGLGRRYPTQVAGDSG